MPEPYADSAAHLRHELERADLLVRAAAERFRAGIGGTKPAPGWGIPGVPDAEVAAYLAAPEPTAPASPPAAVAHTAAAAALERQISVRVRATRTALRLDRLRGRAGLDRAGLDVLLLCLLPALDPRYRRLYGYLMDDATRTEPTVDLLAALLPGHDPVATRAVVTALAGRLLVTAGETVRIEDRVAEHLRGGDSPDPRLGAVLTPAPEPAGWDSLILDDPGKQQLQALADWWRADRPAAVILLQGPYGSGRRTVAAAFTGAAAVLLLVADLPAALAVPAGVALVHREAVLRDAAVCWTGAGPVIAEPTLADQWHAAARAAARSGGLTFVCTDTPWEPADDLRDGGFMRVDLPAPGFDQRRRLWARALPDGIADERLPGLLANAFQLTGGQIADALATARGIARVRDAAAPRVEVADLYEGARRQSGRRLVAFARRIEPRDGLSFDDLVLPVASKRQLDELRSRIAHRASIYDDLGFDRRITLGRGVVAMFTGASGTGKTMGAELLAREQGADLYKVDLAAIVSKYVGETEKNLDRVFADAQDANAMIFFDEADALFAKRGEVKEARDRWANVELAFLLQRIEEHRGVVILASNLRQNVDEAFLRRLHAIVDFPSPDARGRLLIWQGMFPAGFGRPGDEQLAELADRFPLPGGSIRNIVLDGAFRALARDEAATGVELRDLVVSVGREYSKLRLPITAGEFGREFYQWVETDLLLDGGSDG
jgi:hypothetical protein